MLKDKIKKIAKNKIFLGILAIILPFIIEIIFSKKIEINAVTIFRILFVYCIYVLMGIYYVIKKYSKFANKIAEFLLKKRYIIAIIVLVISVLLKINFSSINIWNSYVGEPNQNNTIFGEARAIRSDEWLTQSCQVIGQTKGNDAFNIYNRNIADGKMNMTMGIMPVHDITSIGKPLIWGYLLLGRDYGFSFYWMLKAVLLILVSLELARKISKKDNLLTIAGGIVFAFAPAIMWWLSSAIADGYIFGMMTVLLFGYYMNNLEIKIWKKIGVAIGILISILAFAFTIYPAFQVPFAFVMLIMMLHDFIPNVKNIKKIDIALMLITILGICSILIRFILISWNDIKVMMSTVYPGNRISIGGDLNLGRFISYFANIFFPYSNTITNPCEPSSYIYSFSGLVILLVYNIKNIKEKKNDSIFKLSISLTILYIAFLWFEFIGFGETLAKLTFLSMSPSPRLHVVVGFIGTVLTIILLKSNENKSIFTKAQTIIISLIVVAVSYVLIKNTEYASFFNFTKYEIWSVVIFAITYFLLTGNKKAWCYTMTIVAIVAGATINPISRGIDPIENTKIAKAIQEIKETDEDALWAGNSNITGQYLIANGVKTLNGVHLYPSFEWLHKLDETEKFDEVYNRFAHIHIALGDDTAFSLLAPDSYVAILTYQNLKDLDVKYYYTSDKCSEEMMDKFQLETKYENEETNQYIYLIK